MANEINVKYKLNEDGSIKKTTADAKKLAKETEGVQVATEKARKSKNLYNKQEKGTAGLTSNSTKAFAKQAQTIGDEGGGLVGAYATLAANVFAVTAAFGVLQRAAATAQLEQGLAAVGRSAGQNLKLVADNLRTVTDMAISGAEAMESVAIATSAGFSEGQIESLGKVAKGASLALGRDMTDALTRLVRGTSKLEPELLDELGIFTKLGPATERYADALGKNVNQLTEFERRQAFVNNAIEEGQKKFGLVTDLVDSNPYNKLAASFDNMSKAVLNFFNGALAPLAGFVADNIQLVIAAFASLSKQVIGRLVPSLTQGGTAMASLAEEAAETAKANLASVKTFEGAPKVFKDLQKEVAAGTATTEKMNAAKLSLRRSIDMHIKQMPSFIDSHKKGSQAVLEKEAKLLGAKLALESIEKAENAATASTTLNTRATLLNAAAHGDLKLMLTSLRVAWVGEITATAAATAGKGFLTKALAFLRTGISLTAISVRALGIALLNMIPIIGQVIIIATLAYEGIKSFFEVEPDLLDKRLEEAKKRYEEFPKVVDQMALAYKNAETRAEAFATALRPGVGLLKQTLETVRDIARAHDDEAQARVNSAQKELVLAQIAKRRAQLASQAYIDANPDALDSDPSGELTKAVDRARNAEEAAQQALREAEAALLSERQMSGIIDSVATLKVAFQEMQNQTVAGSSEFKDYQNSLDQLSTVFDLLVKEDVKGAIKILQQLEAKASSNQAAFDASSDVVRKFSTALTASKLPSGEFADTIDLISQAVNNMISATSPETILEYKEAFDRFGISYAETLKGKRSKDAIITPEEEKSLNNALEALKKIQKEYQEFNTNAKLFKREQALLSESARQLGEAGLKTASNSIKLKQASLNVSHQEEALRLAEQDQTTKLEDLEKLKLAVLKAQTDELILQEKIRSALITDRSTSLSKVSSSAGVSIENSENINKAEAKLSDLKNAPEGEKNNEAIAKAEQDLLNVRVEAAARAFKAISDDMAKIGPEGELMSTVTSSMSTMISTFTTAFEIIGDSSASMTDKIQAGLAAGMAIMQSYAAISKASSDARVRAIDQEIEAEKKRDGQSKDSLAKISSLEKKKEREQRKAFEVEKKMKMGQTVIATAQGAIAAFTSLAGIPIVGPALGAAAAAMVTAMGAQQLSMIAGTSFQGGSSIGSSVPTSISVGERGTSTDLATSRGGAGELGYFRGQQGFGGAENFRPAFTGAKYRASGGQTAGFMVGEQGPEMFVPEKPGRIVPADEVQQSIPITANINISAVDAEGVEEVLMRQRGNIIGMIREAANANGETFLESVSTMEV